MRGGWEYVKRQYGFWQCCLWLAVIVFGAACEIAARPPVLASLSHAHELYDVELALGVHPEMWIQRAALSLGAFGALQFVYVYAQVVAWLLAPWPLYFADRGAYRTYRDTLIVSWSLAQACFWCWPCAPPSLARVAALPALQLTHPSSYANLRYDAFAAIPSMHMCFAAILSASLWTAWPSGRAHRLRALVAVWPALVALAVMGTANHFLADVLAGLLLAGVSYLAVLGGRPALARLRTRAGRQKPDAEQSCLL